MSKFTIEEQVQQLTPEQKGNMGKIYKIFVISLLAVVLVSIIVGVGLYAYASIEAEKALDRVEGIKTSIMLNPFNLSLHKGLGEAQDRYYDMQELQSFATLIAAAVMAVGIGVVYLVFKGKYPYFSEKKYTYLKKSDPTFK